MQVLDTQIISYAFKGVYNGQVNQQLISSVTAKEFLIIQGSYRTSANYYVPLLKSIKNHSPDEDIPLFRMDHPFSKWTTDQIILDFGQDYPSIIEFSNYAITEAINCKARNLFKAATYFLDKSQKKMILNRFEFLLDSEIKCIPLSKSILDHGINLFNNFLSNYNAKPDIKNTMNDCLILATAIDSSSILITKDSLLNRFASEYFGTVTQAQKDFISIDFGNEKMKNYCNNRESKEYINKAWKIRMLNSTKVW